MPRHTFKPTDAKVEGHGMWHGRAVERCVCGVERAKMTIISYRITKTSSSQTKKEVKLFRDPPKDWAEKTLPCAGTRKT